MPRGLSAQDLYRVQQSDLEDALVELEGNGRPAQFADSTRYDVLIGDQRYPPKALVGIAAAQRLGVPVAPEDFTGGESSASFRLLLDRGFEVVTKQRRVGALDATFSVGRSAEAVFLIYESRGPNRNRDYNEGLEAVLMRLGRLSTVLAAVEVDSRQTRELAPRQRRLALRTHTLPLRLDASVDIHSLRLEICAAATSVGRAEEIRGGGNPSKRLRMELELADDLTIHDIAEMLAEAEPFAANPPKTFSFIARPPGSSSEPGSRREVVALEVTRLHVLMQQALYAALVSAHGRDAVSAEQIMPSGAPADLVVRVGDSYEIYEIKTAANARECVRQAIGQLLEYAYWSESLSCTAILVVGPSAADEYTERYLERLRRTFGLPLRYLQQTPVEPRRG